DRGGAARARRHVGERRRRGGAADGRRPDPAMSNLTVADLRAANPATVRACALAWAALGDALDAAYERFLEGQKRVDRGGAGAAVRAAAVTVVGQGHELSGLCSPARQIARAL